MLVKNQIVALLSQGFEEAASLSGGRLWVIGHLEMGVLTDGDKFISRQIEEYVIQGYYQSWSEMMGEFVHEIFTPVALLGCFDSVMSLIDTYEELGLGVFHRHPENDIRWRSVCQSYRTQIKAYFEV